MGTLTIFFFSINHLFAWSVKCHKTVKKPKITSSDHLLGLTKIKKSRIFSKMGN